MIVTACYAKTASAADKTTVPDTSGSTEIMPSDSLSESISGSLSGGSSLDFGSLISSASESGSTSQSTASTSASSSSYDLSSVTAFTLYTQDAYMISLSVDELDILSVSVGQSAEITLDAISDQAFEGTVSKVGTIGSTSGGSTKYTVEITIPRDENMRIGMSASATITISESENAVLIPLSALQEKDGKTYVYTSVDENGNLSGETEVETGLSNSSQVEITSGLSEGDTVYYQATSSSSDDSVMVFGSEMDRGEMTAPDDNGGMNGGGPGGGMNENGGGGQMPGGN